MSITYPPRHARDRKPATGLRRITRIVFTAVASALLGLSVVTAVLPASPSLAPASPATVHAQLLSYAAPGYAAAPDRAELAAIVLPVLAAPAGLHDVTWAYHVRADWNAVTGAHAYELRIGGAGGTGTGTTRFDRVLFQRSATVYLGPGRYIANVRAGRSASDVHGHWSATLHFTVPRPPVVIVPSSAAARALAWAFTQAGKWYSWGGAGPSTYDCSGLVMIAYARAAGISLPHNTVMMLNSGHLHWISSGSARPGDLVMWGGSSPYHVELFDYAGHTFGAHQTGERIGVAALWGSPAVYRVT